MGHIAQFRVLTVTLYKPLTIARQIFCNFKNLHKVSINQRHMPKRGQIN